MGGSPGRPPGPAPYRRRPLFRRRSYGYYGGGPGYGYDHGYGHDYYGHGYGYGPRRGFSLVGLGCAMIGIIGAVIVVGLLLIL